jgi:hypothetical protein
VLHFTAIPLRPIAKGDLDRYECPKLHFNSDIIFLLASGAGQEPANFRPELATGEGQLYSNSRHPDFSIAPLVRTRAC